jgi:integrase/recombinase XerD
MSPADPARDPVSTPPGLLSGLAPIDTLTLPADLDGQHGLNRARQGIPQIAADNDVDAIKAWLARYIDSRATFESYRKEAERLLLWSTVELRKPLSSLTHEDLLAYGRFLEDPQPAQRWVMHARKLSRSDPLWRPFAGPLSAASRHQAVIILNGLFSWLVNAGYLAGNPLSLSRQRRRREKPQIDRYLDHDLWASVKASIDVMPRATPREREHHARVRWLIALLYLSGLRISEAAANTMGGFFTRADRSGEARWWLRLTGKGDKERLLPATRELVAELTRYRLHYGLSALPYRDEATPLVLPIGGQRRPLTRAGLHLIIKQVFENAVGQLPIEGEAREHAVRRLRQASAHWLRHTAGSHMMDQQVDLRYVRDNLGHESISTTNLYLHTEDDDRHQATESGHKLNW